MANDGQFGTGPVVPPGWYADPMDPSAVRYWTGSAWTEHVAPAPAPVPAPSAATPAQTWVPTLAAGGNPSGEDAASPAYGSAAPSYGAGNPAYGAATSAPWAQAQGQVTDRDLDGAPLGFGAAIKSAFRNYVTFHGRASRSAYWWFALFASLVELPFSVWYMAAFIGGAATAVNANSSAPPSFPVGALVPMLFLSLLGLALFLPSLGLAVRRLHDCNRSGAYFFLGLIPFVGPLILLIFYVQEGTPGPNQYSLSSGFGGQQPQAPWR